LPLPRQAAGTLQAMPDYSIAVSVNNLTNPIIKINLGENQDTMQEITAILSIITAR